LRGRRGGTAGLAWPGKSRVTSGQRQAARGRPPARRHHPAARRRPRTGRRDLGAADRAARGRWGLAGRNTNAELVSAARAQIAELGKNSPGTSPSSHPPGPAWGDRAPAVRRSGRS